MYSRQILWIYIGTLAKTKLSVFAQYLATVQAGGRIPQIVRSDRGVETAMLADVHLQLSELVRGVLEFEDAFWYSTSKQNQTIESWWGQQAKATVNRWRDWFHELAASGQFNHGRLADRLALLEVYMPILRKAVLEFVYTWNTHKIRYHNVTGHISGVPLLLYTYPQTHGRESSAVPVDLGAEQLQEWLTTLDDFGELPLNSLISQ